MIRRHLVFPLRPLAGALLLAAPAALRAESKSVSVTKEALTHTVEFGTPTPGTAVSKSTGVKHDITVNNNASGYDMDSVTTAPDSDSDEGAWRCRESTKSLMKWKITALRNTALAYAINGGITERPPSWIAGMIHSGGPPPPRDHRDFSVTVPAATVVRWNNALGSHASPSAKSRLRVAVGEKVSLEILNSHLGNPVWTATGGWFQAQGGAEKKWETSVNHYPAVTWHAPTTAGSYTVTLEFPKEGRITGGQSPSGKKTTLTFEVIYPEGDRVTFFSKTQSDKREPTGSQTIEVRMRLTYALQPRTVNFDNMLLAEDNTDAATQPRGLAGFHQTKYDWLVAGGTTPTQYIHHPTPEWISPADGKTTDQVETTDIPLPNGTVSSGIYYSWGSGSFYWDIPVMCQGKNPTLEDSSTRTPGSGFNFYNRIQKFETEATPNPAILDLDPGSVTVTVSKTGTDNTKESHSHTATF